MRSRILELLATYNFSQFNQLVHRCLGFPMRACVWLDIKEHRKN